MKKIISTMVLLLFFHTACAPSAQPTEDPASDSPSAPTADIDSLKDLLVDRLSLNLSLAKSEISMKSVRDVEFGDLCLDIPSQDVACAQVVTPGLIFILEANGIDYEYHTTTDGETIQPATLALTWTREGGIAGFCDRMTVYLSGEVYGSNCRSNPNEKSGYFAQLLSAAQQEQFSAWFSKYAEINIDFSDPEGVADRMIHTLVFHGDGTGRPGKEDQQAMFDWALELFRKLKT